MWYDSSCIYPLINNVFVTTDNIMLAINVAKRTNNIDFFSIDIDSHDWHVVKTVLENNVNIPVFCVDTNNITEQFFLIEF